MPTNQKRVGVYILIVNKVDFRTKYITNDKERHFIMIEKSVYQKYKTLQTNTYLSIEPKTHKAKLDN